MWHAQVIEDALEQRQRCLDLDADLQQAADGEEEAALQGGECHDRPSGDARVVRLADHNARDEIHQSRCAAEEGADDREEHTSHHLLAYGEIREATVLLTEAGDLLMAPAEYLAEQDARYGERLLGDGAHLSLRLLRLCS